MIRSKASNELSEPCRYMRRVSEKLTGMGPTVPCEGGRIAERLSASDGVADMGALSGAGDVEETYQTCRYECTVYEVELTVYGCGL